MEGELNRPGPCPLRGLGPHGPERCEEPRGQVRWVQQWSWGGQRGGWGLHSLSGAGKEEHPHGEELQVAGLVDPGQDEMSASVARRMLGSGRMGGGSQCPGPSNCREAPATSTCVRECDATRCMCLPREGQIAHGAQLLWPRPGCSLGGAK